MKRHAALLVAAISTLVPCGLSQASAETLAIFTKSAGNPIAKAVRAGAE
jgi:ABC-type sugar transport system substrate-binding protein